MGRKRSLQYCPKVNEIIQTCQQELLIALPQVAEDIAKPSTADVKNIT